MSMMLVVLRCPAGHVTAEPANRSAAGPADGRERRPRGHCPQQRAAAVRRPVGHPRRGVPVAAIEVAHRMRRLGNMLEAWARPMPDTPDHMVDGMVLGMQRRPRRDRRIR
jgi:hypothetical protein